MLKCDQHLLACPVSQGYYEGKVAGSICTALRSLEKEQDKNIRHMLGGESTYREKQQLLC